MRVRVCVCRMSRFKNASIIIYNFKVRIISKKSEKLVKILSSNDNVIKL